MLMYADDTTLFCNINNDINDNEINRQLNTISEWLLSNKLSLNIKKTKLLYGISYKPKKSIISKPISKYDENRKSHSI